MLCWSAGRSLPVCFSVWSEVWNTMHISHHSFKTVLPSVCHWALRELEFLNFIHFMHKSENFRKQGETRSRREWRHSCNGENPGPAPLLPAGSAVTELLMHGPWWYCSAVVGKIILHEHVCTKALAILSIFVPNRTFSGQMVQWIYSVTLTLCCWSVCLGVCFSTG